jgi:hypothetical protein
LLRSMRFLETRNLSLLLSLASRVDFLPFVGLFCVSEGQFRTVDTRGSQWSNL